MDPGSRCYGTQTRHGSASRLASHVTQHVRSTRRCGGSCESRQTRLALLHIRRCHAKLQRNTASNQGVGQLLKARAS